MRRVSDDDAYTDNPFASDSHVGRFDYEGYKREFESCKGIPLPWSPDPRATPEVDYAWEFAYERYMDEEAELEGRSDPDAASGRNGRTAERGDIEADFDLG